MIDTHMTCQIKASKNLHRNMEAFYDCTMYNVDQSLSKNLIEIRHELCENRNYLPEIIFYESLKFDSKSL